MNIVLIAAPPHEKISGVSTHLYMLKKGLRETGQSVFVIQENPAPWFRIPFIRVPELIFAQVSIYFSRRYRRYIEELYFVMAALWKTKCRIDVLNVQNVQYFRIAQLLKRLTGCKACLTVHGYLTYEAEARKWCIVGDKTHRWLWSLEKTGYDQFDSIICVGRKVGTYVGQFTTKPIVVINNGLDTELFRPDADLLADNNGRPHILFAGVLHEAKGIMDALEVIRILVKEDGRNLLLSVAGIGSLETTAKQFVLDNRLTDNVVFLGTVNKKMMPSFYRSGTVFLCPARQVGLSGTSEESFPYTALEAMSCGVPVIAYKTGGLQEQVLDGVTGYLVTPSRVDILADRVRTLIDDMELLIKMSLSARTHCVQQFSNRKMAQQYLKVYGYDK